MPAKEQYGEKFCNDLISMWMDFSDPGCGSSQSLHFLIDVGVEVGQRIGGFLYLPVDPDRLPDQGVDIRQGRWIIIQVLRVHSRDVSGEDASY